MEEPSPFDINQALKQWRGRLRERPGLCDEDVEELESHLHETIHALQGTALSTAERFLVASHRLGSPNELGEQFERAKPLQAWRQRGLWMILGIIVLWTATSLANLGSLAALIIGSRWTQNGAALGLSGLAAQVMVLILAAILAWCGIRYGGGAVKPGRRNWGRTVLGLIVFLILVRTLERVLYLWAVRTTGPVLLGGYYMVISGLSGPLILLFIAGMATWLVRPVRLRSLGNCVLLLGALGILGCSPGEAATQFLAVPEAKENSATLFEKIVAQSREKPSDAVKAFRQIDLSREALFSKGSPLSYSEAEFIKLPRAVNEKLAQQAQSDIRALKEFALAVKKERDLARSRGDTKLANQLNTQLETLGKRLQGPQNLALSQIVGKAIAKTAAE